MAAALAVQGVRVSALGLAEWLVTVSCILGEELSLLFRISKRSSKQLSAAFESLFWYGSTRYQKAMWSPWLLWMRKWILDAWGFVGYLDASRAEFSTPHYGGLTASCCGGAPCCVACFSSSPGLYLLLANSTSFPVVTTKRSPDSVICPPVQNHCTRMTANCQPALPSEEWRCANLSDLTQE